MSPLAQSLVGRDPELTLLDRLLDEACQGSPRFVVLSGEPGIGKTSLLSELGRRANERGCLVLEGRAAELERELPFGLVVDAFDAYLESLDARSYDRSPQTTSASWRPCSRRSGRCALGPTGTAPRRSATARITPSAS